MTRWILKLSRISNPVSKCMGTSSHMPSMTKTGILIHHSRLLFFHFLSPSILPPPLLGTIPAGTCNCPKAAAKGFVSTGLLPGPPGATPPPGNGIPGGGPSGIPGNGPPNVIPPKLVCPDRPNTIKLFQRRVTSSSCGEGVWIVGNDGTLIILLNGIDDELSFLVA